MKYVWLFFFCTIHNFSFGQTELLFQYSTKENLERLPKSTDYQIIAPHLNIAKVDEKLT